jgi:hypothetical protein
MGRIKEYISTHTKQEIKETVTKDVKLHVEKHKMVYACVATGIVSALIFRNKPTVNVTTIVQFNPDRKDS